ncbi:MFS transporter [Blastococcus sp. CT_GayMR20]|uniref:MFS transporter n=1 Tax=Blastococcus sp. CT_GayMR20 TaxID=2559609 RepID=UPI001073148B|nr:MFS transporter [Blastococcus sp. CT_GayMR20]TFV92922.1 MFS transporter [Blastococcus sp. CT_GayMR20]
MRRAPSIAWSPGARALASASLVATVGMLPVFMVGALAVLVRDDMPFTDSHLGIVVAGYYAAAALTSVPAGRLTERLGGRRTLVLAAVSSGVVLLGMATSWSWPVLGVWVMLGGVTNAVGQMAANSQVARAVPARRHGLAFGIKGSAPPAASLAGGIAVPVIALNLGWRSALVVAGCLALVVGVTRGRRRQDEPARGPTSGAAPAVRPLRPLLLLSAAAAFGLVATQAMASFFVVYAVATGVDAGAAGVILAVGSGSALAARILVGVVADRRAGGHLALLTGMLAVGALSFVALAVVSGTSAIVAVTVVAYAAGWGWPGLLNLAVVRGNASAPAAATGVTNVGIYVGGVTGPLLFGVVASTAGYSTAWLVAAGCLLVATALTLAARQQVRHTWPSA